MELFVDISRLLVTISSLNAVLNPAIQKHNLRVTYIAFNLANKISYSMEFLRNVTIAALMHDIGIMFLDSKEQSDLLLREDFGGSCENCKDCRDYYRVIHLHAYVGYELLKNYPLFVNAARIVKYHHKSYREYVERASFKDRIPFSSQLLLLADRVDTFMIKNLESGKSLSKVVSLLKEKLLKFKGSLLHPKLVDLFFVHFVDKEAFWFELYASPSYLERNVVDILKKLNLSLNQKEFLKLLSLFSHIIDFKSEFTATHSSGVSQVAVQLASLFSFTHDEVIKMKIAGLLHDIGKITIPNQILEKPGKLTDEEFEVMKSHVFHSYKILKSFLNDVQIVTWASYHHERLNGKGYPFKLRANQLSLGARIMAVADVFTALSEDRPYKKGLPLRDTLEIVRMMVRNKELDRNVFFILEQNIDKVNKAREIAQKKALEDYKRLKEVALNF